MPEKGIQLNNLIQTFWSRQISQIKDEGWLAVRRKILKQCNWLYFSCACSFICEIEGPIYIRLGRGKDTINNYVPVIGKAVQITDGLDITIIATGSLVYDAYKLVEYYKKRDISIRLINTNIILQ